MAITFEASKDQIAALAQHFAANRLAYQAPAYKEAHARQEFIDKVFAALGWDVSNASAADQEMYQRQIDATDREIDRLVYELYGLTDEEVAVVAGTAPTGC